MTAGRLSPGTTGALATALAAGGAACVGGVSPGLAALAAGAVGVAAMMRLDRRPLPVTVTPESAMERQAQRHQVTGLPTREPLFERIAADRTGTLGIVAFADFDRLYAFDQAFAEGALTAFSDRFAKMVGVAPFVAQVDRARFALWYGGAADPAPFEALGYALGTELVVEGRTLIPGVATARVTYPVDGNSPALLLSRGYACLGGGEAADPVLAARERYGLEQDLRQAVARGEFTLAFQPLIDAAAGRVCGAEALLRWHHPQRGTIPPGQFIPVIEAVGLADEVGAWVLNAALREARGWAAERLDGLRVAVNVSGHQLERPELARSVARTLARHGLDAAALEIELTETAATGGLATTLFEQLRLLGVSIAIDDFGTGFSSLSTLRTLGFDKLKIDREFVTRVDERRDSQAICRSILALGHGLGIGVLAEGVERPEEYAWLRRHGCHLYQGYYFARPLDPGAFRAFVADRAGLAARLADTASTERLRA